jgi:hypothetical protein
MRNCFGSIRPCAGPFHRGRGVFYRGTPRGIGVGVDVFVRGEEEGVDGAGIFEVDVRVFFVGGISFLFSHPASLNFLLSVAFHFNSLLSFFFGSLRCFNFHPLVGSPPVFNSCLPSIRRSHGEAPLVAMRLSIRWCAGFNATSCSGGNDRFNSRRRHRENAAFNACARHSRFTRHDNSTPHGDNVGSLRSMECQFARLSVLCSVARNRRPRLQSLSRWPARDPGRSCHTPNGVGTSRRPASVSEGRCPPPSRYSARVRTRLSVRISRLQLTRAGWVTVLARCPGWEWETSALRASVDCFVSTAPCLRRPQCAGHFSARVLRLVPATAHSRGSGGAGATAARCADRLRALVWQFAPATMLVPARLCLRHHCHTKHRRLSWRGGLTPSFQFAALHSVAQPSATSPADSPLHCVPFRSLKHRRQADG